MSKGNAIDARNALRGAELGGPAWDMRGSMRGRGALRHPGRLPRPLSASWHTLSLPLAP